MEQNLSEDRIKVLNKIKEYERDKKFDIDVEDDPPAPVLMPNQIDYLNKKLSNKIATHFANKMAKKYFDNEIKKGNLIIDKVNGIENFLKVKDEGLIIVSILKVELLVEST